MRTTLSSLAAILALVSGCASSGDGPKTLSDPGPGDTTAVETRAPVLQRTVVASNLSNPWDLAFTADGTLFFTERFRGLSVRRPDGSVTRLFGTNGSALLAGDLLCQGQSGMLGVALDPAFSDNGFVYVYMTSNAPARTVADASALDLTNICT